MTAAADKRKTPMRENLEGFGIAILFAVLFKPFVIEAYQIPTPSMQPAMMGSAEAGVHDRLLVNKTRYEVFEPERFDIVVFRYPIRLMQNYVKRIVGVPGDRFVIGCGNLVPVDHDGNHLAPITKPERVQERMWRQVFPLRMQVDGRSSLLDGYFTASPSRWWKEDDGGRLRATPEPGRSATLAFTDEGHGGLSDRLYDGYPVAVAQAIRDSKSPPTSRHGVQDVRLTFDLGSTAAIDELSVELTVRPVAKPAMTYALVTQGGEARLVVREGNKEVKASPSFALGLQPGADAARVRFVHLDGVIAVEGPNGRTEVTTAPHLVVDDVEPRAVSLMVAVRGGGELTFSGLEVERDIHYQVNADTPKGHVIAVPEGHYFMMGDNPDQSEDARAWTAITVGMDADGNLVDPATHPDATTLIGNRRARPLSDAPDPDENPVPVPERDTIVFTDLVGEVWNLRGRVHLEGDVRRSWGNGGVLFEGDEGMWEPASQRVAFVPREHILGRPLLNFWPLWPFGPNRAQFIR